MRCVLLGNITCLCAHRPQIQLLNIRTGRGEVLGELDEQREGRAVPLTRPAILGGGKAFSCFPFLNNLAIFLNFFFQPAEQWR